MNADPHRASRLASAGPTARTARWAALLVHGRGAGADQMLSFADSLGLPDVAAFAPEAADHSWWPVSFLAPFSALEPWLGSAVAAVDRAVAAIIEEGFARERIALLGFSQGGCLALEAAARQGGPLGALIGLSSALVGTSEAPAGPLVRGYPDKSLTYGGRLDGVPTYLSCHEDDPHIPLSRLRATGDALSAIGADVRLRLKQGQGHGIDDQDLANIRSLLNRPDPEAL